MPDLSGRELLREWQRLMESVISSAASAAGRTELPRQLVEPLQRQAELVQEIVEREQRLQREVAGRLVAPLDAVFDLVEQAAAVWREQSEALEAAGDALRQTGALARRQAELFERTVAALREPTELAKAAAGLERRPRKGSARRR